MLSQRNLQAFLTVIRSGSISGAAVELGVSQPAVSRHIRDLEAVTGLHLFDRIGNRVSPTEAGHALAAEVERAFVGLSEIEVAAREIRRGRRDRVRIAAMPALSVSVLPDVVASLGAQVTLPDLEILSSSTRSVARMVSRRQALLGFVAPMLETPDFRLLAHERVPLRCVMPAGHPLAQQKRIDLDDLADLDFIALSVTTTTGATLEQLFARMERPPHIILRARLAHVVCALTLRGLGVGIVDAFSAGDHVARGGISRPMTISETFGFSVIAARTVAAHQVTEPLLEHLRIRARHHRNQDAEAC